MDSRRRSFLAAASSVVTGVLSGCTGLLGPGNSQNRRNATGTAAAGAGVRIPTEVGDAYPQYQYDAANTGMVPDVSGPTGAVTSLFEFGQNRRTSGYRIGSPSLRNGQLYLTEGRTDADGNALTAVCAVDALGGTSQWTTMYAGTNNVGPTAATAEAVLATVGDTLVGLDPDTGIEQWSFDRSVEPGITVADGTAYVVGTRADTARLYALSTADGSLNWQTEVDADGAPVTPAVAGNAVFTGGNTFQAFDVASGEERWSADRVVTAPATATSDRVVVGSGTAIRVFDREDGRELWSNDIETYGNRTDPEITTPPAVTDETIYAVADLGLSAFSLTGSQYRYTMEIGINGTPVVADDYLYLLGRGQIACRSAADGATEWSYGTQQRTAPDGAAPVVADKVAYFPAERLYAIAG